MTDRYDPIVCPQCFVEAWEKASGLRANWRLVPEDIHVPTDGDAFNR